ncbi:MAG: sugar phosphate isomerase/epimerase [Chloroflexi bacterium]|nr:sugar phosphate isomerase/epimerase [Chloroflexota bacterium]
MTEQAIQFSVFTKPWTMPLAELGEFVHRLGFDGIEFPVRPGYQVEPETIGRDLPAAVQTLAGAGVRVYSVAGDTDVPTIEACAAAGVPMIRTMARVPESDYVDSVARLQREYEALVPALEDHGVTIGVQNHFGRFVPDGMGIMDLLRPFDPKHYCVVWDAAHEAIQGGEMDHALDIVWPKLGMVNLKNAFWQRTNGPEAEIAEWKHYWTSGRQGLCSWPKVVGELKRRGYRGVVCLTAEYSDGGAVNRLIAEDLAFARSLFAAEV